MVFRGSVPIDAAPTGLTVLGQTLCYYTDTEEIPKQINRTGLKRALKSSRFPRRIRFGVFAGVFPLGNREEIRRNTLSKTPSKNPTGPGSEAVIFLKLTPMDH